MTPFFPLGVLREPSNLPEAAKKYAPDLLVKDPTPPAAGK